MTIQIVTGHLPQTLDFCAQSPLPFTPEVQLKSFLALNSRRSGGGALTGEFLFVWVVALLPKEIARSEQLRDRSATFGQKGCSYVRLFFELFNEQWEISL